jgi:hypothetical protein
MSTRQQWPATAFLLTAILTVAAFAIWVVWQIIRAALNNLWWAAGTAAIVMFAAGTIIAQTERRQTRNNQRQAWKTRG